MNRNNFDLILNELIKLGIGSSESQIGSLASVRQYLLLYELFQEFVPKGSKVLDWGAGIGHFSYFLCRTNYKAYGFSLEPFRFKSWLKGCLYNFTRGKTNEPVKLPYQTNYFDAVASVGVLEHVHEYYGDERKSLKEINRILKPNGIFICYHFPNKFSWIEFIGKLLTNKFHHQYRFSEKEIRKLAKDCNFKILKIGRYGFLPRNSLGKLPEKFAYSKTFARFWDTLDNLLTFIFKPICQNYYFVAQGSGIKK